MSGKVPNIQTTVAFIQYGLSGPNKWHRADNRFKLRTLTHQCLRLIEEEQQGRRRLRPTEDLRMLLKPLPMMA